MEEELKRLEKKLDKLLNLNTKIAKALHLIPVSPKEERDLQIMQRRNLQTAADTNAMLNEVENIPNEPDDRYILNVLSNDENLFSDALGEDYLSVMRQG